MNRSRPVFGKEGTDGEVYPTLKASNRGWSMLNRLRRLLKGKLETRKQKIEKGEGKGGASPTEAPV
jgi:hypothetical protein